MPQDTQRVQGYRLTEVPDLTGGVDLRRSVTRINPNRARELVNWDISNPGELKLLPGYSTFSTSSLGARRIQGADRIYLKRGGDNTFTLVAENGSLYKPSDAGVWGGAVDTGLHATNLVSFLHDRDLVAWFDGSGIPQKSEDGTTWTQHGIDAPSTAPTAAGAAGGSLTDATQYSFVYTYVDDGLVYEGNGSSSVSHTISAPNQTVDVTVTASADAQVDDIYVYARNDTAGEQVYRRAGTRGANTTGTVSISTENWSTALEVPTDHDVWPACLFGFVWKNRWWGVDATTKNRLHFSQIFLPQAKPALFFVDLPFEHGDDIKAVATLGDVAVVWGSTQTFLIIGQTSLDFEVRPSLGSVAGALGPNAWTQVESGAVHAASDGIYLFDGATDRLLTLDIDTAWKDYTSGATADELYRTPMEYHQEEKLVRVGVTRRYPAATPGEWVMFLSRNSAGGEQLSWGATDRNVGGYLYWNGPESVVGSTGRLFTWTTAAASLIEQNVGFSADGSDQVAIYEGPGLTTGLHTARFIDSFGEYLPAAGTLGLEVRVDESTVTTFTIATGSGGPVYDTGLLYDNSVLYPTTRRKFWSDMLPLESEGRTIQTLLTFTGQNQLIIYNYATGLVPEPIPRGFAT